MDQLLLLFSHLHSFQVVRNNGKIIAHSSSNILQGVVKLKLCGTLLEKQTLKLIASFTDLWAFKESQLFRIDR